MEGEISEKEYKGGTKRWIKNIASKAEEVAKRQHMKTLYLLTNTLQ